MNEKIDNVHEQIVKLQAWASGQLRKAKLNYDDAIVVIGECRYGAVERSALLDVEYSKLQIAVLAIEREHDTRLATIRAMHDLEHTAAFGGE